MKKNLFVTISLMLIFLSTIVVGQVKIPYENIFSASSISIARTQVKVGSTVKSTTYGQATGPEIGMEVINDSTKNVYRTYYKFNLFEIHNNATIKEVKVIYNTNSTGHSFKITHINKLGTTNSNNWTVIGTSGNVKTGLVYSGLDEEFISSILKTKIQGLLSKDEIILGGLSEKETTNGSSSDLDFSLYIKWERPAETYSVTVKNDMSGWSGGFVGAGNTTPASRQSPHTLVATETVTYKLKAFDNQHNDVDGYNYIYNDTEAPLEKSEWKKKPKNGTETHIGYSVNQTFLAQSSIDNANYIAYLKKLCNVTFTSNKAGGAFRVNGQYVESVDVVEGNEVTIMAWREEIDDIEYRFEKWSDGSTDSIITITINANTNITAHFKGYAVWDSSPFRGLQFSSTGPRFGNYMKLTWFEHPNSNVTKYEIWRDGKTPSGDYIEGVKIGTVYRGTTSFIDYSYTYSDGDGDDDLLGYDVRAYYQPDNTLSDTYYQRVYGDFAGVEKIVISDSISNESPKVDEFSLDANYPNPFNPSTQISYQIPENSFVSLVVYNTLGQEVATLVNQQQSSGEYTVQFDASTVSGGLPSGIYIYKLVADSYGQTGSFSSVKKMLLLQ